MRKGAFRAICTFGARATTLELTIAADQYESLLAHLDRFIIMDDVELAPASLDADGELTGETPLGLAGPLAAGVLARLGLPELPEPLTAMRAAVERPAGARGCAATACLCRIMNCGRRRPRFQRCGRR